MLKTKFGRGAVQKKMPLTDRTYESDPSDLRKGAAKSTKQVGKDGVFNRMLFIYCFLQTAVPLL